MTATGIRIVELGGAPRQRGRQHGEQLRRAIIDLHEQFRELMLAPNGDTPPVTDEVMLDYARAHEPYIVRAAPDLHAEMQGIAEGAGVTFDTILVLNCVADGLSTCESRCAVVLEPAEAAMWVTDGTPCSHPFTELRLARPSASDESRLRAIS